MIKRRQPPGPGPLRLGSLTENDDGLSRSMYRQEISDIRLEKLSNRLTIITILLPCVIAAIVFFLYIDIKERVTSVHDSGQSEVKSISEDLEGKLNAMNVELAKIKLDLENTLPEVTGKLKTFQADFARIASTRADRKETEKDITALEKRFDKLSNQYKEAIHIIDRTNAQTLDIVAETNDQLKQKMTEVEERSDQNTQAVVQQFEAIGKQFQESSEARTAREESVRRTLSDYETEIATLRKDISLIQKKTDDFISRAIDQETLETQLTLLKAIYDKKIEDLYAITEGLKRTGSTQPASLRPMAGTAPKTVPAPINPANGKIPPIDSISEQDIE